MKLRLTPRAENDLFEIAAYLVARNPQAARRVEDALQDGFALIATYPHVGHVLREGVRRLALPRYPYLIFYGVREADDAVDVFAVRHAARRDEE
ncbi:type II toxin-antitoxin system RelE/ParE family toxin [Methylobacterium trifolii]|uniref:Toxin RelE4 n=1 Tax=Methylobacterium trifolii TaxID=1003092 RepID=A0ABQ4U332_9HYPH|nr:type II toxin-antitoxin system RelE/ParE family toxin [Methylobacterium trifolii]GJE61161.1 Toxin RelE4 [Methylobacterium trifolii]